MADANEDLDERVQQAADEILRELEAGEKINITITRASIECTMTVFIDD